MGMNFDFWTVLGYGLLTWVAVASLRDIWRSWRNRKPVEQAPDPGDAIEVVELSTPVWHPAQSTIKVIDYAKVRAFVEEYNQARAGGASPAELMAIYERYEGTKQ